MKNFGILNKIQSLQLPGKKFLIVLVVTFSAVSFTLGYFVGKSGTDNQQDGIREAAAKAAYPLPQETAPQPGSSPDFVKSAGVEEAPEKQAEAQQPEPFVVVEEKQPAAEKKSQPAAEKHPARTAAQQAVKAAVEKPSEKKNTAAEQSRDSGSKDPLYTVQMGAFSSSSEAASFRKKYAEKGIKTFVVTAVSAKKEKVYKVQTGEFRNRKDADLLCVKLNKAENLKTFVTAKSE